MCSSCSLPAPNLSLCSRLNSSSTQLFAGLTFKIRGQTITLNVGENATNVMTVIGLFSGTVNDADYTIGAHHRAPNAHMDDQREGP